MRPESMQVLEILTEMNNNFKMLQSLIIILLKKVAEYEDDSDKNYDWCT